MTFEKITAFLKQYPKPVKIMEVCGTHTTSIVKSGIRDIISPEIRLVSGPGCPVCVTPSGYIDELAELSLQINTCVLSFGDLFRVPGDKSSFFEVKARGGSFRVIYSPLEVIPLAIENPHIRYAIASVGFETTTPVYAALLEELIVRNIKNVRLYTSLKTMPAALSYLCDNEAVDGFLCPGHVSSIIGGGAYDSLAAKYKKPFVISGFSPEHILIALYHILRQIDCGEGIVENLYKSAVSYQGNLKAKTLIERYFYPTDGFWRGIGRIENSALTPKFEYSELAVCGSQHDGGLDAGCLCGDVMLGRIYPNECELFGSVCRPDSPIGACMVSAEGSCGIWYDTFSF